MPGTYSCDALEGVPQLAVVAGTGKYDDPTTKDRHSDTATGVAAVPVSLPTNTVGPIGVFVVVTAVTTAVSNPIEDVVEVLGVDTRVLSRVV